MSDGFTVAAGTQNGKVLIYDLRALGSGGAPAKSFDAHSHTHVSCVTFQHAPAKSAKGKPKVGGKENAKPTTVAAAAANVNEAPTPSAPLVANAPGCARFHARGPHIVDSRARLPCACCDVRCSVTVKLDVECAFWAMAWQRALGNGRHPGARQQRGRCRRILP